MKIQMYGKRHFRSFISFFKPKNWLNLIDKTSAIKEAYPIEVY